MVLRVAKTAQPYVLKALSALIVFLYFGFGGRPKNHQNCTDLCPQSGWGQVMGSAVFALWFQSKDTKIPKLHRSMPPDWLRFGQGKTKEPKYQNCADLCPQNGWGQVMGSAILIRSYVCSKAKIPILKLHRPMSPEWLKPGHGVCSFGTVVLWFSRS